MITLMDDKISDGKVNSVHLILDMIIIPSFFRHLEVESYVT